MNKKVLIAMSGGVDSSAAACLLAEGGYECIGATMILSSSAKSESTSKQTGILPNPDVRDAEEIARTLGIPFYTFDFSDRFRESVIDGFVHSYLNGSTPNPCVVCNRTLKFGLLCDSASKLGCDHVATGHYARAAYDKSTGRYLLKKALSDAKDQSYVLYSLTQKQLSHVFFPLGEKTKDDVRMFAGERGLPNARKQESQDICFIPDGDYAGFIEHYLGRSCPEGDFIDKNGTVLGRHKGIIHYTIGQRKGLGIAFGEPMYVIRINAADNTVMLGTNEDLFSSVLFASDLNLISCERIDGPMRVKAKVRYRHTEQWATAEQIGDDQIRVEFDEPQRAITPGQAVVLYDGDLVVGGATINMAQK